LRGKLLGLGLRTATVRGEESAAVFVGRISMKMKKKGQDEGGILPRGFEFLTDIRAMAAKISAAVAQLHRYSDNSTKHITCF
jgi:hypothetical protein